MIYAVNKRTKEHQVVGNPEMATAGQEVDGKYGRDKWLMVQATHDGWIEWQGGECPLPDDAECEVRLKDGWLSQAKAGEFSSRRWLEPDRFPMSEGIIAYRPVLDADDKPEPAWSGEGLPPVGCECEVLGTPTGSWSVGVIDYIDGKHCIWHWTDRSGETIHNRVYNMQFRPIRSEEDRAVEEMVSLFNVESGYSFHDLCRALYRAGYRKP